MYLKNCIRNAPAWGLVGLNHNNYYVLITRPINNFLFAFDYPIAYILGELLKISLIGLAYY